MDQIIGQVTFGQVTAVAAIIGALAGAVGFLFKALVNTKNQRINELVEERDYWRDALIRSARLPDGSPIPDYEAWFREQHPPTPQQRPGHAQEGPLPKPYDQGGRR